MSEQLETLRSSVAHLGAVVERLDPADFDRQAYPSEWSIADVLSHIGSGAVILARQFDDIVGGRASDQDFNQSVWDEWNAKPPAAQVADALIADSALLERLESLPDDRRDQFQFSMGPMNFDFAGFVGLRLNEHALHTWDVEVAFDPAATLSDEVAGVVVDNLEMIVRFTGKPSGATRIVRVHTNNPSRNLVLSFGPDSIELSSNEPDGHVDLEIPAESFVRLIYGRLDPDHTPSVVDDSQLDELRRSFPGI
jgi:uncharacterized protein (TIGR03083 family)